MITSVIPEIGGGAAYGNVVTIGDADTVVSGVDGLVDAVNNASSGETIFVPGSNELNLSGHVNIGPPSGATDVTVASDRGYDGSDGALLYDTTFTTNSPDALFLSEADGWRMSGFRIRGPEGRNIEYDSSKETRAIWTRGANTEVDNCELFHWTVAGHSNGGLSFPNSSTHTHHNVFHDCAMRQLGYGFDHFNGHALIQYNYFNGHRHAITCAGFDEASYEACYNFIDLLMFGFPIDMHGQDDGTAGKSLSVHHNTIMGLIDNTEGHGDEEEFLKVRGVPTEQSEVYNNWSRHSGETTGNVSEQTSDAKPVLQETVDSFTNLDVHDNSYGEDKPSSYERGCPRALECAHLLPTEYDSDRDVTAITNDGD